MLLEADGGNIASVLANLKAEAPESAARVREYLSKVVPGTVGMEPRAVGPKLTLEFRQEVRGGRHPWRFLADNVSDGTLRVLGVLVALYQGAMLVGIEEPEGALHPAAAGVLTGKDTDGHLLAMSQGAGIGSGPGPTMLNFRSKRAVSPVKTPTKALWLASRRSCGSQSAMS